MSQATRDDNIGYHRNISIKIWYQGVKLMCCPLKNIVFYNRRVIIVKINLN